jgi:hypothetical protein
MTDMTPTPEQRAAWNNLQEELRREDLPVIGFSLAVLAPLLPESLTKPQVELPKEPGLYVDARGAQGPVWRVNVDKTIDQVGGYGKPENAPLPFQRLVPERPPFTWEELRSVYRDSDGWESVARYVNGTPDE